MSWNVCFRLIHYFEKMKNFLVAKVTKNESENITLIAHQIFPTKNPFTFPPSQTDAWRRTRQCADVLVIGNTSEDLQGRARTVIHTHACTKLPSNGADWKQSAGFKRNFKVKIRRRLKATLMGGNQRKLPAPPHVTRPQSHMAPTSPLGLSVSLCFCL